MTDLSSRLAELSPKKRELLLRQLDKKRQTPAGPERIPRQPREPGPLGAPGRFPVSFSQLREWILDQLEPGSAAYNIPGGANVRGRLDLRVLAAVVQEIVRRHESLRTTFAATEGEPVQVVAPELRLQIPVIDLAALPEAAREAESWRLIRLEERLPFDLARGPLLRVSVLRLAEREHAVRFTMHHIVSDGWSVNLFFREMAALYAAFAAGRPSPLPELPVQYADFAVWQRGWLQGEVLERHLDYWHRQLDGAPPFLPLPTDHPRPPVQTLQGGNCRLAFGPEVTRALRTFGQREGASLFMVLAAAVTALLARWSGQDDISLGTYSGNRGRAELESLIGFFINTLVLRTDLSDGPGFRALVGRMRETALGAFSHQDLPFEKLLEALKVERDLSHAPLFQVHLLLQNFPSQAVEVPESDLDLEPVTPPNDHATYDLAFELAEADDEMSGTVKYSLALFEPATVDRMIRHLLTLAEAAVRNPEAPAHELPLLDPVERRQLLADWSGARVPVAPGAPVHELVLRRAAERPGDPAVEAGDRRWTYGELADRAHRLARHLARLGVAPEVPVGIVAERSPELLAGMLAVLAAGGAYVPLDPAHPEERLAWMLEDAGIPLLLTRGAAPSWAGNARIVSLDGDAWEGEDPAPLRLAVDPGSAAYVIYTSGSTGQPKGVVVEHRSLAAYARDTAAVYGVEPGDRVLQFASLGFDTSAEEIWPALMRGSTLVLRSDEMIASPQHFAAELGRQGITVLNLPTAYWHDLAAGLDGQSLPEALRLVVVGGEKALAERLALWQEHAQAGVRLFNTYGPTEATIVSARREIGPEEFLAEIPLGRPIAGARVYVVDRRLQAVPQGVAGELLVGGVGLARGYLGRPDLTAAAFVSDPFGTVPGERLYRTGDRVRFLLDGELEFLGRIDRQVKIRGFRIEPGEIESALTAHPDLRAAAVDVRPGPGGAPRLVAWVVPAGEPLTATELRRHLAGRLPEPLLPSAFVTVEALPLNRSGKVDRRALPEPEGDRPRLEREYVPPEGPVEEAIAAIWAEVLGVERVGVQDNFFELGGHSLLATQAVARIRERLRIDLQLIALFQMPTVEQLAVVVEEAILDRLEALEDAEVEELL